MIWLPRIEYDELLTGLLFRAAAQLRKPVSYIFKRVYGVKRSSVNFFYCHQPFKESFHCGSSPESLLREHSLLAYESLFKNEETIALQKEFLASNQLKLFSPCISMHARFLARSVYCPRLCEECVKDDMRNKGFSYWRTSHQIPGGVYCRHHHTRLMNTNLIINRAGRCTKLPAPLDLLATTTTATLLTNDSLQSRFEQLTHAFIASAFSKQRTAVIQRIKSQANNLLRKRGFREHLNHDLRACFGDEFLKNLGASYWFKSEYNWPGQLLASFPNPQLCTVRHLVLLAFLMEHKLLKLPQNSILTTD
jgi:hypothetical protein